MKPKWDKKPCGCVKTVFQGEHVMIRCSKHDGKPSKRVLCHWEDVGGTMMVRHG